MVIGNRQHYDVIILGGGAAGLMCAMTAGQRGRRTLLLEHNEEVGKKILISGGGHCNFTNLHVGPHAYQSENPHFCKSALSRYMQTDFIRFLEKHGIAYYEKKDGQLFCVESAQRVVDMLLSECGAAGVEIKCNCRIETISRSGRFDLLTGQGHFQSGSLVVATGGVSIPKLGATALGYDIARQFGLRVTRTRPGLVPFVFSKDYLANFKDLSGISIAAGVRCRDRVFRENILVTHRGISGPAILQISSYWREGDSVEIDLLPDIDLAAHIHERSAINNEPEIKTVLSEFLPRRFVNRVFEIWLTNKPLKQLTHADIATLSDFFHHWRVQPGGTEGFKKAEVTVGGVDTHELSSKTFESKKVPGLFFIGEVLDVTGWLGGYNFQWAWSSGFCAGQFV